MHSGEAANTNIIVFAFTRHRARTHNLLFLSWAQHYTTNVV